MSPYDLSIAGDNAVYCDLQEEMNPTEYEEAAV
jgi:hypothetical protein